MIGTEVVLPQDAVKMQAGLVIGRAVDENGKALGHITKIQYWIHVFMMLYSQMEQSANILLIWSPKQYGAMLTIMGNANNLWKTSLVSTKILRP